MGATSVTGKGLGSADGKNKGSMHNTLGVGHLIGPRVVLSGLATTDTGTVSFDAPTLSGADTDYVVITADTNTSPEATGGTMDVSTGTITIKAANTASHIVAYAVVKVGVAG